MTAYCKMEPSVVYSLQTRQSSGVPISLGVFRGVAVVATVTDNKGDVIVHCMQNGDWEEPPSLSLHLAVNSIDLSYHGPSFKEKDITLRGHHEAVTLLSFSKPHSVTQSQPGSWPTILCSVSADAVLLWDMETCFSHIHSAGNAVDSCYKHLNCVSAIGRVVSDASFSHDVQYLALCIGQEAIVCNIQSCEVDTTLVGHTAAVTCSVFSPHHQHRTIITASEDRTFKVWDLVDSTLSYQSPIVSASPFLCVGVGIHMEVMATGTADGIVRVFDLSEGGGYKCLLKCDVTKELERLVKKTTENSVGAELGSSTSARWLDPSCHMTDSTSTSSVDVGPAILSLHYCPPPPSGDDELNESSCGALARTLQPHISDVLRAPTTLLVVTHTNLLQFNAQTLELANTVDFRDSLPSVLSTVCIPSVTAVADVTFDPQEFKSYYCGLGAMFSASATVVRVYSDWSVWQGQTHHCTTDSRRSDTCEDNCVISVLSRIPLTINSPLKAELSLKIDITKVGRTTKVAADGSKKQGKSDTGVTDKPLTFKSKVKSSGYTDTPRTKAFVPKTSSSKLSKKQSATAVAKEPSRKREYPRDSDPTTHLSHTIQLTDRPTAVNSCCFSGSGQYLTCACADRNAYSVRMPPSLGRTHAFVGHNESVLSACWNHNGTCLMSCSKDKTVRLWSMAAKDPLLCLDKMLHNFKGSETSEPNVKGNTAFNKDITAAQFYYMDKFILLTTGNSLCMYKYFIDKDKPDDIKRYQSNTRYKIVTALKMEAAQTITAMSCINDFHSYIVLVSGSNKMVEIYDMNVGRSIRTCGDVHSRPVHCIQQNKGSKFISHPPGAYDLYLTAAVTDGIKLWDLRSNRCVSRFASHFNQALSVSATFSPCGRFIATGSEDKTAYVYDIRSSSPLHKLKGHSDVVGTLAYHPLTPMLVTASLNGTIKFFDNSTRV